MHTLACYTVWLLASQITLGQFSPIDNVQLQPAPMSVELNSPSEEPVLVRPRFSGIRTAPATPIDQRGDQRGAMIPNQASVPMQPTYNQSAAEQFPAATSVRSNIARMSFNEESRVFPVEHTGEQNSAAALLRLSLSPLGNETLEGQPTSLLTAIQRAADRGEQLQVVKAYWRLSARIADFHWAGKEAAFLASLPQPRTATEQVLLHAARSEAKAREQETRLAAVAGQFDLAEISRRPSQESVPFPSDVPFAGIYRTNFTTIFASRTPSTGILRLVKTIPIYHELIEARSAAAASAFESLQAVEDAYTKGQSSLTEVLKSYDHLNRLRLAFVNTVRDYNFAIAEYSLSVVSPSVSREQIVSTLIRSTPQNRATAPVSISRGPARAAFHDAGAGRVQNPPHRQHEEFAPPVRFNDVPDNRNTSVAPPAELPASSRNAPPNWRSSTLRSDEPQPDHQPRNRGAFLQDPNMEQPASEQRDPNPPVTVADPNQPPPPPSFQFNNSP